MCNEAQRYWLPQAPYAKLLRHRRSLIRDPFADLPSLCGLTFSEDQSTNSEFAKEYGVEGVPGPDLEFFDQLALCDALRPTYLRLATIECLDFVSLSEDPLFTVRDLCFDGLANIKRVEVAIGFHATHTWLDTTTICCESSSQASLMFSGSAFGSGSQMTHRLTLTSRWRPP